VIDVGKCWAWDGGPVVEARSRLPHMRVIEVKRFSGQPLAHFAIWPMPGLPPSLVEEQHQLAEYLAPTSAIEFYFLVTSDVTYGWRIGRRELVFRESTPELLALYSGGPQKVLSASADYLAELVRAWIADLGAGWKSLGNPAPGETVLTQIGFIAPLQAL
jgi:hypothetical protein